jgi:Ser/Thr protein kinase RdoA (MazF antagonist)
MTAIRRGFDAMGEVGRARRLRPLAVDALHAWGLDVDRIRLISNGFNAVFRIDASQGVFALRVNLPRRTDDELAAEISWLLGLASEGRVRVPEPVETSDGAPWAVGESDGVPEPRRCVLFRWLRGRPLIPADDEGLFAAFGEAIGRLHEHARRSALPVGLNAWDRAFPYPEEPPILFDQPLPGRVRTVMQEAFEATGEMLSRLWGGTDRPRITHQDLHIDNTLTWRGSVGILDFDDTLLAFPAQDLGSCLFQNRIRGCSPRSLRALRRGYEAIQPWPDDRDVETSVAAGALALANAIYQDFDPAYRDAAGEYVARWARVASDALRRL